MEHKSEDELCKKLQLSPRYWPPCQWFSACTAMNKTLEISPCQRWPNSTAPMIEAESTSPQTFHRFFDCWFDELNSNLEQLVSVANHHHDDKKGVVEDDAALCPLIDKVVGHYERYYKAKSDGAKRDVISMFTPTWLTTLEAAFSWIAGWRPTTAIHLLYSKSGIQFEAKLTDLFPETDGDLGDLTTNQINRIDELQKKTIREERDISEKMATIQESAADPSMVDLSNAVSEMIRNNNGSGRRQSDPGVDSALESKKDGLEEVLHMADGLRMETLKSVIEILTPIQAVYFLIAAAELHLRIHDWGKKGDAI